VSRLKPRSPARDVARAAFADALGRLVRQDPLLRRDPNEDAVHDARVAVRRLRSDLRTFRSLLDEAWARGLSARLRWLQDGFAAARDADVLLTRVRRHARLLCDDDRARAAEMLAVFREERDAAYARMRAMLDDRRYAALLREMIDLVKSPRCSALADEPACEVIPPILGDAWSALRKRVRRRARPPSDSELHHIRIAAKRVRYAAEAVAPLAGRRARALARTVEAVQTVLGEQHDAVIAGARLRASALDGTAFVAGELAMIEQRDAVDRRRAWRHAWRDAERAHRRLRRAL